MINFEQASQADRVSNDRIAANTKDKFLAFLSGLIELKELEENSTQKDAEVDKSGSALAKTNKIFVVHGHDEEMKQHVARIVMTLKLHPVILHEQANAGKTIIEKFEHNADVGFAVVLLSPDDMAFTSGGDAKRATPRARQNVILELGYFVGKLGRDRVFTLKRGETLEVPSDFNGVVYTTYDLAGSWRFELVRELIVAGYDVDANDLL
jgi:predicted nucleotide-binding protein